MTPMHWRVTARREYDRHVTSRGTVLYGVCLTIAGLYVLQAATSDVEIRILGRMATFSAFSGVTHVVVPVGAVLFGYRAISKERETGTITITAGVPQSRWAALIGIYTGRFAVLAVVTLGAFLVLAVAGSVQYGLLPLVPFVLFCIPALLSLAASLAVGVGVSALTRRSTQSATVALVYVFTSIFWIRPIAVPLYEWIAGQAVNPFAPPADPTLFLLQRLHPVGASHVASNWVLGADNAATNFGTVVLHAHGQESNSYLVAEAIWWDIPAYLHPAFGFVILGVWLVGMLAVGYLGFRSADLTSGGESTRRFQWVNAFLSRPVERALARTRSAISASWYVTGHREASRLVGTRGVLVYGVLLAVVGVFYLENVAYVADFLGPSTTLGALQRAVVVVTLPTALVFGYRSISKERESGTVTFTAGVPQSRWNLLFGVLAGRFVVLAAVTIAVSLALAAVGSVRYGLVSLVPLLLFCLAALLFLAANLSIGVGVSALTKHSSRSATVSFVYFVIMGYFWVTLIAPGLYVGVTGTSINMRNPPEAPALLLLQRLSPYGAFNVTTNWILGIGNSAAEFSSVALSNIFAFSVEEMLGDTAPFYLEPVSGPILLVLWSAGTVAVGYLGFRRADLA